jgi:hypothetical protein
MNPPSVDIKDLLIANGTLGLTLGTNLFVSEIPETNALAVGVYDYPGEGPELEYTYERPNVQVQVRGGKVGGAYVAAHQMAQRIRDVLIAQRRPVINGARYILITCLSDVGFVGYDENHRPQLTVNFRIHRTSHP